MGNPEAIDLIRELRTALGLFDGAMPVAPKDAWDEALGVARKLTTGRCWACLEERTEHPPDLRDELVAEASITLARLCPEQETHTASKHEPDAATVFDSISPGSFKREDGTWVRLERVNPREVHPLYTEVDHAE